MENENKAVELNKEQLEQIAGGSDNLPPCGRGKISIASGSGKCGTGLVGLCPVPDLPCSRR